jgi:hypothetical protein
VFISRPPTLPPRQVSKISLRVDQQTSDGFEEMKAIVAERISDFLLGRKPNGAGLPKAVLKSSLISEVRVHAQEFLFPGSSDF